MRIMAVGTGQDSTTEHDDSNGEIRCILCPGKRPRERQIGYACWRCRDWLSELLGDVLDYHNRMAELLLPGASNADADGKKHGKLDFGQPPLHFEALNLVAPAADVHMFGMVGTEQHEQLAPERKAAWQNWHCQIGDNPPADTLRTWIRMIWEDRNYAARDMPSVGGMVSELRKHLDWICQQEWVGEFVEEMRDIRRSLSGVAAVQDGTSARTFIGLCTNIPAGEVEECGAEISARPDDTSIRCRDCGTDWPFERWLLLGRVQEQAAS